MDWWGGFGGKSGLGLYSCLHQFISWLPLYPSVVGSPLLTVWLLGWHYMGNLDFGCIGPASRTTYITPLPLILTPFIYFPISVHMCPLGPHRVSLPPSLAHSLGWA